MLYSATVITTIGYGNITPKTTEGKIATMVNPKEFLDISRKH
jgi:hypothetical protein